MPVIGFLVVLLFVGFEVSRLAPQSINLLISTEN